MFDHFNALTIRLSHEKERLAKAKRAPEIEYRKVVVKGIEKEIEGEKKFLASKDYNFYDDAPDMTDDELFAELSRKD